MKIAEVDRTPNSKLSSEVPASNVTNDSFVKDSLRLFPCLISFTAKGSVIKVMRKVNGIGDLRKAVKRDRIIMMRIKP
jgi:hypothetical protein